MNQCSIGFNRLIVVPRQVKCDLIDLVVEDYDITLRWRRYMLPGFPNLGACERPINCHESGGLWVDFIENRGFRTDIWKKNSSFLMKIAVRFELLDLKIVISSKKNICFEGEMSHFSFKWGSCEWTCASTGGLVNGRRGVKRGSWGPHIPVPPFR